SATVIRKSRRFRTRYTPPYTTVTAPVSSASTAGEICADEFLPSGDAYRNAGTAPVVGTTSTMPVFSRPSVIQSAAIIPTDPIESVPVKFCNGATTIRPSAALRAATALRSPSSRAPNAAAADTITTATATRAQLPRAPATGDP